MNLQIDNQLFKKSLTIFWAAWWLFACWTDVVGGLAHLGLLTATWAPDTNYPYLVECLKIYPIPTWLPAIFFVGIIIWTFLSGLAFTWAAFALNQAPEVWMRRASIAYVISLILRLVFFMADQVVMKFDLEENHMVQGGFELLAFFALYLLPSEYAKIPGKNNA